MIILSRVNTLDPAELHFNAQMLFCKLNGFDDGKIRPSRLSIATISKVIPFAEINPELLDTWKQNVEDCYWLYATETDYFIEAEYDDETAHFVRTTDGGWFSLGWFGARLDIDGSLYKSMNEFERYLRNE